MRATRSIDGEPTPASRVRELKTAEAFHRGAAVRRPARARATRLMSLAALAALAGSVIYLAHVAVLALTDAWVAPVELSPDSREVLTVRIQAAKEREERARLETELASVAAQVTAIDNSVRRLRSLERNYSNALRWSTNHRAGELGALNQQMAILEQQQGLLAGAIDLGEAAVKRVEQNVSAGVSTVTDLDDAKAEVARARVTSSEKQLERARVEAQIAATSREAAALVGADVEPAASAARRVTQASPEVIRFDEVRANIELQVTRLEAEKRAAEARREAALAGIRTMEDLHRDLEATPLFLAAEKAIDLAFVPYASLRGLRIGDSVIACRWFVLGCRVTGRVKRAFPGEVVTDDPWGSVARGRYVELEMSDRSAMGQRTLRVRPYESPARTGPAAGSFFSLLGRAP